MTKSVSIASSKCVCAALSCLKDLLCIWRRHAFDNAGTMRRCPAPIGTSRALKSAGVRGT